MNLTIQLEKQIEIYVRIKWVPIQREKVTGRQPTEHILNGVRKM